MARRMSQHRDAENRKAGGIPTFQRCFGYYFSVFLLLVVSIAGANNEEGKLVGIELGDEDKITITKYSPGSRPVETSMFGPGFFYYSTGAKPNNAEEYMYMPIPKETSLFIYKNKELIKTANGPTTLYYKLSEKKANAGAESHAVRLPEGYRDAIAKAIDIGSISNEYLGKLSKRLDWIDEKTHRLVTGMNVKLAPLTMSAYKFGASAGRVQIRLLNEKGVPIKEPINAVVLSINQTLQPAVAEQKQIDLDVPSPGDYFLLIWNEHTQAVTIWITTSHTSKSSVAYRGTRINFGDIIENQKFDSLYNLYNIYNINIPQKGDIEVHFNEKNFRVQLRSEEMVFERPPFKISVPGMYQLKVDVPTGLNLANQRKCVFTMSLKFKPEIIIWKTKEVEELDGPPF